MVYDEAAVAPVFANGNPPRVDIESILAESWAEFPFDRSVQWRLISARRKLGKTLFEIEVDGRRVIGKIGKERNCHALFAALTLLWNNGFRPPNRCTVSEAVGCLPERGIILQELAPGKQAFDYIMEGGEGAVTAASQSAEWLTTLHASGVQAPEPHLAAEPAIRTWIEDLQAALPDHATRLAAIKEALLAELSKAPGQAVPCHGDFHMMNIFIAESGRLTAIDLDKFTMGEREADVGYFLSQTASLGYMEHDSFRHTALARSAFLERYQAAGEPIRHERAALYMASAFLKNLHFELCLLKTDNTDYVEPWLRASESALLHADIRLDSV